ncbi:hypothetical protein ZIOFF_035425 [Zingiber officinale]|uniref:NAC domain-containing protein n=2 Tax=Zingiber officinale TaxID=94328 RepID=A0A8J5GB86_ZINOF|nr:hypothetical protein ZIOFF_035425 [Zingiber officinale]
MRVKSTLRSSKRQRRGTINTSSPSALEEFQTLPSLLLLATAMLLLPKPVSLPPGFRFHPTDEELVLHYLRRQVDAAAPSPWPISVVAEVDIYKHDPWELPGKATYGEREWYFITPRGRKYPNGFRPNRAAASGYWKATGTDKPIYRSGKSGGKQPPIGVKKALVFYRGKPPRGAKTNWIMHEYRLAGAHSADSYRPARPITDSSTRLDEWVLCRIYRKNDHLQAVATSTKDREGTLSTYFDDVASSWSFKDYYYSLVGDSPENMQTAPANSHINGITDLDDPLQQPMDLSALASDDTESLVKRQRTMLEGNLKWQNCEYGGYSNDLVRQLDSNSSSFLEPHFIDKQLLLNSHWGLH